MSEGGTHRAHEFISLKAQAGSVSGVILAACSSREASGGKDKSAPSQTHNSKNQALHQLLCLPVPFSSVFALWFKPFLQGVSWNKALCFGEECVGRVLGSTLRETAVVESGVLWT